MVQKVHLGLVVAALLIAMVGCSNPPEEAAGTAVKEYQLRGRIVSLDPTAKVATIQHEEIVGWMLPMTMGFPIKDEAEFKSLQPGQQITATVYVQGDTDYWLGNIKEVPTAGGEGK